MKVVHIMKDGTTRASVKGLVVPPKSEIYNILKREEEKVKGE